MAIKIGLDIKAALLKALLYSIYFSGLTFVYSNYITRIFGYEGFSDDFSSKNFLLAFILTIAGALVLPRQLKPSSFFIHLGMGLVIVPALTLFSASNLSLYYVLTCLSSLTLIGLVSQFLKVPRVRIASTRARNIIFFCTIIVSLIIATIFAFGGWKYLNFNFLRVYDLRRSAASILPEFYAYLIPAASKALIPFGIVLSALQKKWRNVAIFSAFSILIFALTAHKAPAFYPFIILFVYWISSKKHLLDIFLLSLIGTVFIGGLDFWIYLNTGNYATPILGTTIVRRALIIPSLINWFYIDFFSNNSHYFWSQSSFSLGLVSSPFELNFVNLIAKEYFNSVEASANTGWIGSGYANAGLFGVYFYSVVLGLLFSLLDSYSKKVGLPLVLAVFAIPVITMLLSTDLPNMLVTHGLLISLSLLVILNPKSLPKKHKSLQSASIGV